jgi:hypothetical protein
LALLNTTFGGCVPSPKALGGTFLFDVFYDFDEDVLRRALNGDGDAVLEYFNGLHRILEEIRGLNSGCCWQVGLGDPEVRGADRELR